MVFLHHVIIQNLYDILRPFVKLHKLGSVHIDGARYILVGTPEAIQRAYIPDFSFLRRGRIPVDFDWSDDFPGAPDFAIEVASPGQTNTVLLPKIARYLQSGCEEVWLIYPWRKEVYQYRRDQEVPAVYKEGDSIDLSALFPGLSIAVKDLFVTSTE